MLTLCIHAQSELEYKFEIGAMGGLSSYQGDLSKGLYSGVSGGGAALFRYNINPRMALKVDLGYGGVRGDATKSKNKFPDEFYTQDPSPLKYSGGVFDLSCAYELNFWAYGTGRSYKGTKRLTPYILLGAGFSYGGSAFALNFPLGIGIKYKVAPRLNIGLDWEVHFTTSDKIDKVADPYRIKSGFLKNKDSYCWTMLYISYDICPKLRKCASEL